MGLSIDIDAVKVENNKALAGGAHEKQGFRVILRLGHDPDDDLVFMSGGPFILNGGTSLYTRIVEHVALSRGCKIIHPLTEDKARKYDGNAAHDEIHQSHETLKAVAAHELEVLNMLAVRRLHPAW